MITVYRYQDQVPHMEQTRTALVVSTGRKWMQLLVIEAGNLRLIKRPLEDQRYLAPLPVKPYRAKATLRRLARKKGTSRTIRNFLRGAL